MSRVNVANEFEEGRGLRDTRLNIEERGSMGNLREFRAGRRAPVVDAPVHGGTKVKGNAFEGGEMDTTGCLGEL
jgi:hypothetical protein